jgi:hypothetical protein
MFCNNLGKKSHAIAMVKNRELTKWVTEVTIYQKITKEKELLKERRKKDI